MEAENGKNQGCGQGRGSEVGAKVGGEEAVWQTAGQARVVNNSRRRSQAQEERTRLH